MFANCRENVLPTLFYSFYKLQKLKPYHESFIEFRNLYLQNCRCKKTFGNHVKYLQVFSEGEGGRVEGTLFESFTELQRLE